MDPAMSITNSIAMEVSCSTRTPTTLVPTSPTYTPEAAPVEGSESGEVLENHKPLPSINFSRRLAEMRRSPFGEIYAYKQIRQIGKGGFGNCFLLERKIDKALRVCKVQYRAPCFEHGGYEEEPLEVSILRDILPRHERILQLHEVIVQTHTVQLYYDYCAGGDLSNIIQRYNDQWLQIPDTFMWHAYLQLSEALAYIHHGYSKSDPQTLPTTWTPIIHGDIKDQNIFLTPPNPSSPNPLARVYPSLVLGDFGLASLTPSSRRGTPRWQPPELPVSSCKADVWAIGAVMHALAHEGEPPLAPMPQSWQGGYGEWCKLPQSRMASPLYGSYGGEMHQCVFVALESRPARRADALQLCCMVETLWDVVETEQMERLTPLIEEGGGKRFDENGVTLADGAEDAADQNFVELRGSPCYETYVNPFADGQAVETSGAFADPSAYVRKRKREGDCVANPIQIASSPLPAPPAFIYKTPCLSPERQQVLFQLNLEDLRPAKRYKQMQLEEPLPKLRYVPVDRDLVALPGGMDAGLGVDGGGWFVDPGMGIYEFGGAGGYEGGYGGYGGGSLDGCWDRGLICQV